MPLSNTQYDELLREYDKRQIENRHIVDEHIREAYGRDPRLAEIDESISSYSVSQAKKLLEGDEGALKELKENLAVLQQQKAQIIKSLGYPTDYFEPPYRCKDCKDTGHINGRRCHCFKQAAIDLVYTQSNLKNILKEENFEHFSLDFYSRNNLNEATGLSSYETAKIAFQECHRFIDTFDQGFHNLFLYGDTGIGKTFLSNCIARELLDSGHSVIYFTASQLFDIFEKDVFKKDNSSGAARQNIYDCDLLILDDLGTEVLNSFTSSQLYLCLNERILRKRSTIISTNLSIGQLADLYSERTFSRISSCYTMIKLFGDDIRIAKKLR